MGNRRRLILINLVFASEVAVVCGLLIFPDGSTNQLSTR
jgi:hypothetical protein